MSRKPEGVVGSMRDWAKSRPDTEAVDLTGIDPEGLVQVRDKGLGGYAPYAPAPIAPAPESKVTDDDFFLWQPGDSVHEPDPLLEAAWSHLFQERQD